MSWENLKEKPMARTQDISRLPICAFNSCCWYDYFIKRYEQINENSYKILSRTLDENNEEESVRLTIPYKSSYVTKYVYPKIVYDERYQWSARNICTFINKKVLETKNKNFKFTMFSFKNKKFDFYIEKENELFLQERENDEFERLVYIKFYNLSLYDNKIIDIYKDFNEDLNDKKMVAFVYNYGIPIFIKCIQKNNKISFEEADKKCAVYLSWIFRCFEDNEDLLKKLFTGMIRSSILWEPYNKNFFDWRERYKKIILLLKMKDEVWWREEDYSNYLNQISSCKILFGGK